jgi:hypothetical protein
MCILSDEGYAALMACPALAAYCTRCAFQKSLPCLSVGVSTNLFFFFCDYFQLNPSVAAPWKTASTDFVSAYHGYPLIPSTGRIFKLGAA